MVTSYLVCVGALARVVKDKARRDVNGGGDAEEVSS
jgi:hypothetical protein